MTVTRSNGGFLAHLARNPGLKALSQSSGDPIADGRFAYAQACLAEGDTAAARDLFEQTIEAAPGFAPAWLELGKARLATGRPEADAAFTRCLALEPEDALGAGLYLAQLPFRAADIQPAMTHAYVRRLFDHYAPRFEAHLQDALGYDGPERLFEAVARVVERHQPARHFGLTLDLGCGTGLAGQRFAPICEVLEGCDLAPAMLVLAASKGIYRRLEALDCRAFLEEGRAPVDLILAADVFPYLGDLAPIFEAVAGRLAPGGLFAFSLQSRQDEGFALGADFRYAHSMACLNEAAQQAHLSVAFCEERPIRHEHGVAIPGLIVVLVHASER